MAQHADFTGPLSEFGAPTTWPEPTISCACEALASHLATFVAADREAIVFTGPEGSPLRRATLSRAWRRPRRELPGLPKGCASTTYGTTQPP